MQFIYGTSQRLAPEQGDSGVEVIPTYSEHYKQLWGLEALAIENVNIIECQFNNIKNENVPGFVNSLKLENVTMNMKQVSEEKNQ